MGTSLIKTGAVIALAGALAVSAATPSMARNWGRTAAAAGIGFAAGTIIGSTVANSNRAYYGPGYAYDPYYGGAAYYDEPAYAYEAPAYAYDAPAYAYESGPPVSYGGGCWKETDNSRPFGYYGSCATPTQTPTARAQARDGGR